MKKKKRKTIDLKTHLAVISILILIALLIGIAIIIPSNINNNINRSFSNSSFSIIIVPDTQYYSKYYPYIFINQTQWIKENQEKLNIRFVIHEGDLVNDNNKKQWDIANQSLFILEQANIPFSLITGNHDTDNKANYTNFNHYFPVSRFEKKPWFGGNFDNYKNNYQLLNINNISYIFLNLNFCPDNNETSWANNILNLYNNSIGILTTHGYLDTNEPPERYVYLCGSTEYIWNKLIKLHPNLQLVFSGHMHVEKIREDKNLAGKPVYQIIADYQDEKQGKSGYLRIIEWDQTNNIISIKTYSPYLNKYKKGYESEFSIKL